MRQYSEIQPVIWNMTPGENTLNVMVAGASEDDQISVELMLNLSRNRQKKYQLCQFQPLHLVDIVLIDIDHRRTLKKWQQIVAKRKIPTAVYMCDKYSDVLDLDNAVRNAGQKAIEKSNLLKILDLLDQLADSTADKDAGQENGYRLNQDIASYPDEILNAVF